MSVTIGTATAATGETARGHLVVTELPTGPPERVPVAVVAGEGDGPTLWVTGAVHGDEATGLAVAQDLVDALDPAAVSGTVVVVPALNPAGLRRNTRTSYYGDEDPNRGFPDPESERHEPPSVQELADARVFEAATESVPADALLDLHTATVGSIPFVIRDRVLYGQRRDRETAADLADRLADLAAATGLPVVTEYGADAYVGRSLQRSTAGAALNAAGVPALTLELGSHSVVEERDRRLGLAAVCRAAVAVGVLDGVPADAPTDELSAPVDYPVRRHRGPRTDTPGVCRHTVAAGDPVEAGETVARVVTAAGEERATVETDRDGYVLGRRDGVAVYENDPVTSLAVRDDGDLVVPRDGETGD
ncbi:deacylase [Halobacteriales archaeon SW_7_71_33]|nr:MAG: deacylase [Halobacteriales archaeon SW_7_71_33]